jgi:carbon monoxide dehydrogenase subunit G
MPAVSVNCHIDAPVERVFALASDFPNLAETVEGITKIEMLTDGPMGIGTRYRETRIMFKRECTEEMEITEFRPNEGYVLIADSHGCIYRSEFTFLPEDGGTKITMAFDAQAHGFLAKLMLPLSKLMMGTMVKCVQRDLDCLKARAEREATAAS